MTLATLLLGVTLTIAPAKAEVVLGDVVELDVRADGVRCILDDRAVSLKIDDGHHSFVYVRHVDSLPKLADGPIVWMPTRAGAYTIEARFKDATAKTTVTVTPTSDGATRLGWRMETTKGAMTFEFAPEPFAPNHVAHFAALIHRKFFDGLTFHRVIRGFMAQGGDPLGNGEGGPGYTLPAEFETVVIEGGRVTARGTFAHIRGRVSTARDEDPNSGGSQFFICFNDLPRLRGKYSVFAALVDGDDTLTAIEAIGSIGDRPPSEIVKITKSTLVPVKPRGSK